MGAPEVLTRIAYQAIGMNHKLPIAPSQNEWLVNIEDEEVEVTKVEPSKTRGSKRKVLEEEGSKQTKGKKPISAKQHDKEDRAQRQARFERMVEEFKKQRVDRGDFAEKWIPEERTGGPRTKNLSYT